MKEEKETVMAKEKWEEMMDFLVINQEKYNDEQWAERFELACQEIPATLEVTHTGCNKVITERVLAYCKKKGVDIKDYDGPLPYRAYKINVK